MLIRMKVFKDAHASSLETVHMLPSTARGHRRCGEVSEPGGGGVCPGLFMGPSAIPGVLVRGRPVRMEACCAAGFGDGGRSHQPGDVGSCPQVEKPRGGFPLEPLEGTRPCWHLDFSPLRPILDFWPPELYDNKFMLFEASKFVVIFFSSNQIRIRVR